MTDNLFVKFFLPKKNYFRKFVRVVGKISVEIN